MSFSKTVITLLAEKDLPIQEVSNKTGLSVNYVRTQLRIMEMAGIIRRADDRTPIYYQLNPDDPMAQYEKEIAIVKKKLLAPASDSDNFIGALLKSKDSKKTWTDLVPVLDIYSSAIKQLSEEGKLMDTL